MNIIDRVILEWSYKTKKGYPDINSQEDMDLFESIFGFNLNETPLTPAELDKVNSNTKENRIDILIRKIKNKEPLAIDDSEDTFLVYDPRGEKVSELEKWDVSKKAVTLFNREGNSITTSKLAKSADFGGGAGSGAGSAQTDIQESSMCAVLALYQKQGKLEEKDLTSENIKSISKDIETTSSVEEIVDYITNSPGWASTFVNTASLLSGYLDKGYEFHRGSSFVDSIYEVWKKIKKKNKWSIKDDKWNPSDIWAVKPTGKNIKLDSETLEEYNNQLLDLFNSRTLIGISLKKLGKSPTVKTVNKERVSEIEVLDSIISSGGSKDAYVNTKSGKILQLRTTGGNSFQGELKGKTAAQGKIGGGVLKTFLDKQGLGPIPTQKESAKLAIEYTPSFVNELLELCNEYFSITEEELNSKTTDWLNSKYQALKVAKVLKTGSKDKVEAALTDIVNYAGSRSSISAVYLKVM